MKAILMQSSLRSAIDTPCMQIVASYFSASEIALRQTEDRARVETLCYLISLKLSLQQGET
jgi:hypothetical protein